jgi:hypothetical protein
MKAPRWLHTARGLRTYPAPVPDHGSRVHPEGVTDTTTADRAYVQQATTPADAAGRAAALHGISLPGYAAQQIADAVLGYADNTVSVRDSVERRTWQDPGAQEHLLQRLRHRLLDEITSQGLIPTALPAVALRYASWLYGSDRPLPMRVSETEPAEWDTVEVTLTTPVRVPPVDRKAAMKAGLLSGGTP